MINIFTRLQGVFITDSHVTQVEEYISLRTIHSWYEFLFNTTVYSSKLIICCFVLYINYFLIFTECRSEDEVNQSDRHVTEVEGRSVTLQCKYKIDSSRVDLFWYIQRANDFPKYILRRSKYGGDNGTEFQERFHSKLLYIIHDEKHVKTPLKWQALLFQ